MRKIIPIIGLILSGCASTAVLPIADDTFQVTASTATACGIAGAQRMATRQAAAEVIRRGYDRYVVENQSRNSVVGTAPGVAQSYRGLTVAAGGGTQVIQFEQGLTVKILREGDAGVKNALSARQVLGPNWDAEWRKILSEQFTTCF